MSKFKYSELWLSGPVEGVPALLQPVAHALLQAKEEIHEMMRDFPEELLWDQPAGVASAGFHLQHIVGVLDRTFTYAEGKILTPQQMDYLQAEGKQVPGTDTGILLQKLDEQIDRSVEKLKTTDLNILTEPRGVGRQQLPSTVLGLLFHAAEHTMRHLGQLLVTTRVLKGQRNQ
jgi:uncharacterized damage-inducible protein DinB